MWTYPALRPATRIKWPEPGKVWVREQVTLQSNITCTFYRTHNQNRSTTHSTPPHHPTAPPMPRTSFKEVFIREIDDLTYLFELLFDHEIGLIPFEPVEFCEQIYSIVAEGFSRAACRTSYRWARWARTLNWKIWACIGAAHFVRLNITSQNQYCEIQDSELSRSNGLRIQRSRFPWSFSSWSCQASSSHSRRVCTLLPQLLLLLLAWPAPGEVGAHHDFLFQDGGPRGSSQQPMALT